MQRFTYTGVPNEEILKMFLSGKSAKSISEELGTSKGYIYKILSNFPQYNDTKLKLYSEVIELFNTGVQASRIAEEKGLTKQGVYDILDRYGVQRTRRKL